MEDVMQQGVTESRFPTQSALANEVNDLTARLCQVRKELAFIGTGGQPLTPGSNGDHDGDVDIRTAVVGGRIMPELKAALVNLANLHCSRVLTQTGQALQVVG
jgi:hypothetical protein